MNYSAWYEVDADGAEAVPGSGVPGSASTPLEDGLVMVGQLLGVLSILLNLLFLLIMRYIEDRTSTHNRLMQVSG